MAAHGAAAATKASTTPADAQSRSVKPDGETGGARIVIQRVNTAELLVDNADQWQRMERGIVLYVSFTEAVTDEVLTAVAKTVSRVPVVSYGDWGDGVAPMSISDAVASGKQVGLMVIPQANLVSRPRNYGKTMSYRRQCEKNRARDSYHKLCVKLMETVCGISAGAGAPATDAITVPVTLPPSYYLRVAPKYLGAFSEYDDQGVATHDSAGEPLSKSQRKKLTKVIAAHSRKHRKALSQNATPMSDDEVAAFQDQVRQSLSNDQSAAGIAVEDILALRASCPPHFITIFGTFGNRQGLRLDATLGPFSHMYTFA